MGESKRYFKNKARVEGSISATYLHREIVYFCFNYFQNFTLSSRNYRIETQWQSQTSESILLVFKQVGRHASKECTHWLTDVEFNSTHVHVLINYTKVKSYLE